MKYSIFIVILFLSNSIYSQTFSFSGWSQIGSPQYRGRTFSKDSYTFTKTSGGNTMSARLSSTAGCTQTSDPGGWILKSTDCFVSCDCSGSGPTYGPGNVAPTVSGNSLVIGMDWSNTTSIATLDLTFTSPISNPSFTLYDVNTNNNFADLVIVSAVNCAGTTIFPSSVTGMSGGTVYNSTNGTISQSIIDNSARGNGGSNITVNFNTIVSSIKIIYRSNPTIPVGSNPSAQFLYVGQIVSTLSVCSTLPIELSDFYGTSIDRNRKKFEWVTESESNNDYFTLEHSFDGLNFYEVEKIDGAGTTSNKSVYSKIITENAPSNKYYRLKQTDFDGSESYSNVIYVESDDKLEEINLFPNPSSEKILITFKNMLEGEYDILIFDLIGKQIMSEKTNIIENSVTNLNIQNLKAGNYVIKVIHKESGKVSPIQFSKIE